MSGLLLDTHAVIWMIAGEPLRPSAEARIAAAQAARMLFISPITAWEVGVGALKRKNRPDIQGLSPDIWFDKAVLSIGARVLPITKAIAVEASRVPAIYGSGDPGDCFLIATARVRRLSLVTRDERIANLANRVPGYLQVFPC
jgi:PIN domain nuclease of toxin-antitoxin system